MVYQISTNITFCQFADNFTYMYVYLYNCFDETRLTLFTQFSFGAQTL